MNEKQTLVIELPDEAKQLLTENGVDLITALRESGLDVTRSPSAPPVPVAEGGKEVALTIIAVGVAVTLVANGIVKILDALGRNKKFIWTEHGLATVLDASGRPVYDAAGQPVLYPTEKTHLIEAKPTAQGKDSTVVEARPYLLKISLKSEA